MKATSSTSRQKSIAETTNEEFTTSAKLLQRAFDNSLLANIIFIAENGRIIRVNRAACKLLGYSKEQLLTRKREDIFKVSESSYKRMLKQRKEKGHARADLFILRKNGQIWPCEITSVLFKDANGISYSISSFVDRRERMSTQRKLDVENKKEAQSRSDNLVSENNDWITSIARSSYDVIWDWDIPTNLVSFGKNYDKVFGYKLSETKINFDKWIGFFPPKERANMKRRLKEILKSNKSIWNDTYQFLSTDGTMGQVISRANIIRNDQGKAIRMIGVIHDISRLNELEGELLYEVNRNEKRNDRQITAAVEEAKELERSDIGKELHDNVNQLLGAAMLYLNMARTDIENGDIYLVHTAEYTLTAIEAIRNLSSGLVTDTINDFGLTAAIERMVRDTIESNPAKIHFEIDDSLEDSMGYKFKLNTFRILQEQLNNIIKHAKASEIDISIIKKASNFILSISDNGIGFDSSKKTPGIGIANIINRAKIFKGNAEFVSKPGQGCKLLVSFPVESMLESAFP